MRHAAQQMGDDGGEAELSGVVPPTRCSNDKPERRGESGIGALHGFRKERLLYADEVAAMLGVTEDWVYAKSRAGDIPTVKIGRYRRYRPDAIDRWIEEMEEGGSCVGSNHGHRKRAGSGR